MNKLVGVMEEARCYECTWGIWLEDKKMNECQHNDAGYAVANYCYNRRCPYYTKKVAHDRPVDLKEVVE